MEIRGERGKTYRISGIERNYIKVNHIRRYIYMNYKTCVFLLIKSLSGFKNV